MYTKHYTQEQVADMFGCGVPNICKISKRIGLNLIKPFGEKRVYYNSHHILQLQDHFYEKRRKKVQQLHSMLVVQSERLQEDFVVDVVGLRKRLDVDNEAMLSLLSDLTRLCSNLYEDMQDNIYYRYGSFDLKNNLDLGEVWKSSGSIQISGKEFR